MTQIFPDIQEWYANKQTNKPAHTSPVQHVLWRPDKQKNRKIKNKRSYHRTQTHSGI